jgi:predicted lipoprotein with Yx(FWY)xxD motif
MSGWSGKGTLAGVVRWRAVVPLAAGVLAAAACSSSGSSTSAQAGASTSPASSGPAQTAGASPSASGSAATTITAGSSKFGPVITAGGRVVYLFEKDKGTVSACYGACAAAWPPVLATSAPAAGNGVTGSLLGTARRSDGTTQVTYGGFLLYYFSGDSSLGDVSGEGVQAFGGGWDLVSPAGKKVEKPGS